MLKAASLKRQQNKTVVRRPKEQNSKISSWLRNEKQNAMTEQPSVTRRTYPRRVPLCRLCLQEYPKDDLLEIFSRGSDWKKRIFRAAGIKPHRNDAVTRMCTTCRTMVDTIVSFQEICQQTELLMRKSGFHPNAIVAGDHWSKATGLIESLLEVVTQHREAVMQVESGQEVTATSTATIVTEEEIFEVSVAMGEEEYLEEESAEDEEQKEAEAIKQLPVDIKEEEEDEIQNDRDSDYHYEEEQEEESDQEDSEEEQKKPKKNRDRRRLKELKQKYRTEKVMCDTCGELVSQISLEGHLNRHLGVKPFVCEIEGCGRQLYSKYSLQQHRHLHKSIMRYYDCPDCGKRIKGTNCWMRHRKLHTEDPKHECGVCGKKFRRKFGLKLHAVVHTGVALFPCKICGKRFTVKHNLGAHYRTHKRNGTYPAEMQSKEEHQETYQQTEQNS